LSFCLLHGFDRLVFRGHLRQLSYAHGMECYLSANRVLLKDFDRHVQGAVDGNQAKGGTNPSLKNMAVPFPMYTPPPEPLPAVA
jgi:hypothetical protein